MKAAEAAETVEEREARAAAAAQQREAEKVMVDKRPETLDKQLDNTRYTHNHASRTTGSAHTCLTAGTVPVDHQKRQGGE